MVNFKDGKIEGVQIRELTRYSDDRGWLMEVFREDSTPGEYMPVMSYISMTNPGVARGPHEHIDQADMFCFAGPSTFRIYLWDNRKESATYATRMIFEAGVDDPKVVIVPKGVVHAYKNVGEGQGLVLNCPNRLFRGEGAKSEVDEVRYEDVCDSPYKVD